MLSKGSGAYGQICLCTLHLTQGIVLAVDPSVGSSSSMPGYAIYTAGILRASGTIPLNPTDPIHVRLRGLVYALRKITQEHNPDVLVYEDIPAQRYGGGGNAGAHASLLKAVGAILSTSGTDYVVGIQPVSWKPMARSSYVKGDEADAIEIGHVVISEAARIAEITNRTNSKRKTSTPKRTTRSGKA